MFSAPVIPALCSGTNFLFFIHAIRALVPQKFKKKPSSNIIAGCIVINVITTLFFGTDISHRIPVVWLDDIFDHVGFYVWITAFGLLWIVLKIREISD